MLIAHDHTGIIKHENKLWSVEDFQLPGLGIARLVVAAVVAIAVFGMTTLLNVWLNAPLLPLVGVAAALVLGVTVYFVAGRLDRDHMDLLAGAVVRADWLFLQPRRIAGFGAHSEPDSVRLQVITWEPTDPAWSIYYQKGIA